MNYLAYTPSAPNCQGASTYQSWTPESSLFSELPRNTWVKLKELPSFFSHDEALLLCSLSSSEWVAWIPDHGEIVLNVQEFEVPL